jgi:hypothetical protein
MKRYLVTLMVSTLSLYGLAAAGDNPNAKVAVHVKAHYSKQSCGNLPAGVISKGV